MIPLTSLHKNISSTAEKLSLALIALSLGLIYLSSSMEAQMIRHSQASSRTMADEVLYVTDSMSTKLMSLGYQQAAADVMWLRSIQYFVTHLLTDRRYPWLEHFVDQIIDLDPRFKHIYLWAGSCILYGGKITPEKVHASNRIYEAALRRFPNDYEPAYRLGMNYYSELRVKNEEKRERYKAMGIAYFERAAQAPDAPPTIFDLLRGIAKQMRRDDVLFYALTDELLRVNDPDRRKQLESRLENLSESLVTHPNTPDEAQVKNSEELGLAQWIEQARQQEQERMQRVPYIKSLDYEWIFARKVLPLSWRALSDSER
ncbi:MAG: hypothetical protein CMH49_03240 [Myxococcales bacterium]|nr:hypothetical protein [Myxococcales bacterium]